MHGSYLKPRYPQQDPRSNRDHDDLLTSVKKLMLGWYGHVTRSSGLSMTIIQGTVRGTRRKGRPRKRLSEWTGLGLQDTHTAAHDRQTWGQLVACSTAVPNDLGQGICKEDEGEDNQSPYSIILYIGQRP